MGVFSLGFATVCVFMLCIRPVSLSEEIPKIAVIGGGIGGTSTAYFLRQLFGAGKVDLDIYEAEQVGGRLAIVDVAGHSYETGGSIIHTRNKYMTSFVKNFGLQRRQNAQASRLGLWDGSQFIYEENSWETVSLLRLWWRYGYGIFKLRSYIDDLLNKFESIYTLQNKGEAYWAVSDLLKAMNPQFEADRQTRSGSGFKNLGFSDAIVDELIAASIRVNYGQDNNVHKFVGSVSIAGASGALWAIDGGNFRVPEKLLEASEAQLVRDRVVKISPQQDGKLLVQREGAIIDGGASDLSRVYDIVVLAAPLRNNSDSAIDLSAFTDKGWSGQYHHTVSTILQGKLNHSFFGFAKEEEAPDEILVTVNGLFYNSVGRIYPVDLKTNPKKSDVWKVFSPKPLTEDELNLLFLSYNKKSLRVNDWLAYPHYSSLPKSDLFRIHRNFYYLNAIEWAASAMEMSVIGAKNVALLAFKSYKGEPIKSARSSRSVRGLEGGSDEL